MTDLLHTPMRYAYVLLDAESYIFQTRLFRSMSGGQDAALNIQKNTTSLMSTLNRPFHGSCLIKALLFCSKKNLDKLLLETKVVPDETALDRFWDGFTSIIKGSIVDCGTGQGSVQSTLRSTGSSGHLAVSRLTRIIGQFIECLHMPQVDIVILGCCNDTGYIQGMAEYYKSPLAQDRVFFLKTSNLAVKFLWQNISFVEFADTFENQTLSLEEGHVSLTGDAEHENTQVNDQALTTIPSTSTANGQHTVSNLKKTPFATPHGDKTRAIWLDTNGRRVDVHRFAGMNWEAIETSVKYIQRNSVCVDYIFDKCDNGRKCQNSHTGTWSEATKDQLRSYYESPDSPCRSGSACRNPGCSFSHHCPYLNHACTARRCPFTTRYVSDVPDARFKEVKEKFEQREFHRVRADMIRCESQDSWDVGKG